MTSASSPPPPPPPPPMPLTSPLSSAPPPPPPLLPAPPILPCSSHPPATASASPSPARIEAEVANSNGVAHDVFDEMPESSHFKVLDRKEYIDKYQSYKSDYTQLLLAKYFSNKNIYGGNTYEEKMTIGEETIMSSRWPCTRSYADPKKFVQEQTCDDSVSTEKMQSEFPNGNLPIEKKD